MLAIKLKRIGKKHQPSYRLVVAEKRSKLAGNYVEDVGWYDPLNKKSAINNGRVEYWMAHGAQPTDTVHNLLVSKGVIRGSKRPVHARGKHEKSEEGPAQKEQAEGSEKISPEANVEQELKKETPEEVIASQEEEKV